MYVCLACQTKENSAVILERLQAGTNKQEEKFSLYKAGHDLLFISCQNDIGLRTTQWLVQCFKDSGEASALLPLQKTGRPHEITPKTHALISTQAAKEPRLTA